MGEINANHHHRRPPPTPPAARSSRLAVRGRVGEIVEVQGGHIVRSTGRKDRHSKVCTAKGPRDRRVRLSAHTAIQFYDVQDRLGYDRPSKAVDWLIKNAKSAIDELAKLPAWNPNNTLNQIEEQEKEKETEQNRIEKEIPIGVMERFEEIEVEIGNPNRGSSRFDFLPPNFDSEIIADSIKSFFPIGVSAAAAEANSPAIQFQNYSTPDLVSRTSSSTICQNQDLRLSLQSLHDPILLHQAQNHNHHQNNEELFPATTTSVGFHGASFADINYEHDRFHRTIPWNSNSSGGSIDTGNNCHVSGGGGGGFVFDSPSPLPFPMLPTLVAPMLGHNQCLSSQRGPLQSSNNININSISNNNNPLIRALIDSSIAAVTSDYQYFPAAGFGSGGGGGGFSGFRIPARIQGEEEYDGVSDKPSSASSDSLH